LTQVNPLQWRQKQEELTRQQTRTQEQALGQEKRPSPGISPALTAEDSVRNWLAYRERQKQAELTPSTGRQRTQEHAFGKSVGDDDEIFDRRKKKERNLDYDYGL
jgi:hypothetical protein